MNYFNRNFFYLFNSIKLKLQIINNFINLYCFYFLFSLKRKRMYIYIYIYEFFIVDFDSFLFKTYSILNPIKFLFQIKKKLNKYSTLSLIKCVNLSKNKHMLF